MLLLLAVLPVLITAAPKAAAKPAATHCTDRECFISAADDGLEASGTLDVLEWVKFGLKGVTGHAEISVKTVDAACTVSLKRVYEDAPEREGMTKKETLATLNADINNELICKGTRKVMSKLLSRIGTNEATAPDLLPCHPTRCDPVPPLAKGCKPGKCVEGGYAVSCGKQVCRMVGLSKDQLTPGCTYACGDDPDSVAIKCK